MNLGTHTGQNPSNPAKGRVSRKPQAQKIRVKTMHVAGVSSRQIAKVEKIDKDTVNTIVKEADVAEYVQKLREQWYGLGELAIAAERHQLEVKKDGHLGHKVLEGMGVVPKKDQSPADTGSMIHMTPEQGYSRQAIMISNVLLEGHEQLGVNLPEGALERMAAGDVVDVDEKKVKE